MGTLPSEYNEAPAEDNKATADEEKKKRINLDMLTIATALLLQDLPFFCLRMTLIFK